LGHDDPSSTLRSDGWEPMLHTLLTDLPHYRPCRLGNRASSAAVAARILEGLAKTAGLFMVVQDLYPIESSLDAHLVLPAACWVRPT
jgi:arsenite oxidase large subunit